MSGDAQSARDPGAPRSGREAAFRANSSPTARARHAARSAHANSSAAQPECSAPGLDDPLLDPIEEFARAMDDYRRTSGRMFPTWCEVLEVLRSLGYRRLTLPDPLGFAAKGEP